MSVLNYKLMHFWLEMNIVLYLDMHIKTSTNSLPNGISIPSVVLICVGLKQNGRDNW